MTLPTNQRLFLDSFRSYVPAWLSNRVGKNVGYRILWSLIMPLDLMMQAIVEGIQASWPGKGTPTALPVIGQGRGLIQGETETNDHFAARLVAWLDTWPLCGSDEQLVTEIQQYLGNTPTVRVVNRAGNWVQVNPDGTFTYFAGVPINWDSISNPERTATAYWADIWIVVYPCEWAKTPATLASLVGIWGTYNGVGVGHAVPRAAVDNILSLVSIWKGAHTIVRAIIWSYAANTFNPAVPSGLGDGNYGKWGKTVGTTYVPSRTTNARYWEPANG